jgi:hypothetical protein
MSTERDLFAVGTEPPPDHPAMRPAREYYRAPVVAFATWAMRWMFDEFAEGDPESVVEYESQFGDIGQDDWPKFHAWQREQIIAAARGDRPYPRPEPAGGIAAAHARAPLPGCTAEEADDGGAAFDRDIGGGAA